MLNAVIFSIGEELLEGSVIDSNSAFIAKMLLNCGVEVKEIRMLPDDKLIIADSFKKAAETYKLILTTGGLGPTFDDLTAEAAALGSGVKTVFNKIAHKHIETILISRNLTVLLNEGHRHQASLPENATLLPNNHGTAMGFITPVKDAVVISMPGVPHEMYPMMRDHVVPFIKEKFSIKAPYIKDLRFANVPESIVDEVIKKTGIPTGTKCIINAGKGEVVVKIRDEDFTRGQRFADIIKNSLPDNYYGDENDTIVSKAVQTLQKYNLTLSVAESCTGGMLSKELTDISGVSSVFYGGVISYDNSVKINQLDVQKETIEKHGAVSNECAIEMANGVQSLLKTNCAISITGIAGPDGGSTEKPVGTVFIAIKVNDHIKCNRYNFRGERDAIRQLATKRALTDCTLLINEVMR